MSLAQLTYFVAVAEEQHLTRAASRLHISQPPLTRQIRDLETELGVALFARTPRGMSLLPAGEALLARARQILELVELARQDARTWQTALSKACSNGEA
jgi:LysR family transcriptional regulator, benzoate and cis,cis-muconate-responsive activator of ben and cat genes